MTENNPQQLDFPLGNETLVRNSDPETSHEAAQDIRNSGHLGAVQSECFDAVIQWPGDTMRELIDERMRVDPSTYRTRFSELRRRNLIYYGAKRPCRLTGKNCVTLWPSPAQGANHGQRDHRSDRKEPTD